MHVSPVGDSSYHKFRLPLADVIAIHFRNWEVGSKVRSVIDHEDTGEIAAVYDGISDMMRTLRIGTDEEAWADMLAKAEDWRKQRTAHL